MFSRFKYTEYPKSIRKQMIERDKKNPEKGRKKKRSAAKIVLAVLLCLFVLLILLFCFLMLRSRRNIHPNEALNLNTDSIGVDDDTAPVVYDNGRIVEYKGERYEFNENIVSVALLGVDKENLGLDYGVVGTGGQADTIALALYDTSTGNIKVAVIPRDTMAEINTYDTAGGFLDIKEGQICLSYAYGDGRESSCENTIRSINRLMLGVPVDYYLAMDLDGIPALNDAVGGVTLTCLETYGRFTEGETVTLMGEDADAYVRDRDMSKLDSDSSRRARQKQYMESFIDKALSQIKKNFTLVTKLYNQAMNYTVTDISLDKVTYLASTAISKDVGVRDYVTVPGEYVQGEKLAEYHVDRTALFEMILSLYYTKL
ncbi:MAG: LCP family protein [Clostridia bacterium]|nr:LCP family protein [Clostridia bacterium]